MACGAKYPCSVCGMVIARCGVGGNLSLKNCLAGIVIGFLQYSVDSFERCFVASPVSAFVKYAYE